jgi:1,4-alpha-glucan branching enzyme
VWDNADTHWMWPIIHAAERAMLGAVAGHPSADEAQRRVLDQAARELLLLQASDWPFLVTTGQAREYAVQRFHSHVERFDSLIHSLHGEPNVVLAEECWERDKVFPEVDYHWYAA